MLQPESTPLVAIVILNWNNAADTLACLRSLAALEYPSDRLRIVIVDNGSTCYPIIAGAT